MNKPETMKEAEAICKAAGLSEKDYTLTQKSPALVLNKSAKDKLNPSVDVNKTPQLKKDLLQIGIQLIV
jgi:hypothetical protein